MTKEAISGERAQIPAGNSLLGPACESHPISQSFEIYFPNGKLYLSKLKNVLLCIKTSGEKAQIPAGNSLGPASASHPVTSKLQLLTFVS